MEVLYLSECFLVLGFLSVKLLFKSFGNDLKKLAFRVPYVFWLLTHCQLRALQISCQVVVSVVILFVVSLVN